MKPVPFLITYRQNTSYYIPCPELAPNSQTVHEWPPNQYGFRSQTQRLDDVHTRPDPAVKQHRDPIPYCLHNLRQNLQAAYCPIQLPPTMITDDDTLHAGFDRHLRILDMLNAFQNDRSIPFSLQ